MKKLIIDGRFLAQTLTGIQRFSVEILKVFAEMDDLQVIVAMPSDAKPIELQAKNITFERVGKTSGTRWEQFDLPKFCRKLKDPLLCTGSMAPLFYKSHIILHDVAHCDLDFYSKQSWGKKMEIMVRSYIYRNHNLFTDSDFSKERIRHFYPRLKKEPVVVGCGYEHVYDWEEEPVENMPEKFYLSVGSVFPHKNFSYILHLAKNNPDTKFVVVGRRTPDFDGFLEEHKIDNCIFTGYISDGQLAWLYHHCEGFILPSLYEGFGMPPLESVACGCRKIILSDIPVFREIYGDSAVYFDAKNYENTVSLDCGNMTEETAQALLLKYSWKKTAKIIVNTIFPTESTK